MASSFAPITSERALVEAFLQMGTLFASELDTGRLVQLATDVATRMCGAQFGAFFHNVVNDRGESYTLYTLSGAPREAFERFPMPRNTALFGPTFRAEGIIRLDDVKADVRYGKNPPYQGMPEGHLPVTSYLAVPVVSRTGVVLGGLFFGHPGKARFTELHERALAALAPHVAAALDNARLFEKLRRSEEQSRVLIGALAEGVILQDRDGVIREANASALALMGVTREAIVGRKLRELGWDGCDESGRSITVDELPAERVLRTGTARAHAVIGVRGAGEEVRWLATTSQPIRAADGTTIQGVVTSFYDVTDRKRAEAEHQRRVEFQQQLLGIVSHDLRNPISAILLGAQVLLRQETLGERAHKSAIRIISSAERANRMILDLLDLTHVRLSGGLPVSPSAADFHDVARAAVDEMRLAWPERDIELIQSDDGKGRWDGDRLTQAVVNLVGNALTYSPPDSPVRVCTGALENGVFLEVHNQGDPIPEEVLPRIFQAMQRGAQPSDRSRRSVGLGLFIVDQIVRAHHGRVTVRSTLADGTTFRIELPRSV